MTNDKQEALDMVWDHFVHDLAPKSYDKCTGRCFYRGNRHADSPVRCAVGVLIPDWAYHPGMEDDTPISPGFNRIAERLGWDRDFRLFLKDLQEVHDEAFGLNDTPEDRAGALRIFALEHDLEPGGMNREDEA